MKTPIVIGLSVLFSLFLAVAILIVIPEYKGPLESIPMGSISVEKGESVSSVARKMEREIRAKGGDWTVSVDPAVMDRESASFGGGGGCALMGSVILKENFGCRCFVLKDRKQIWIRRDSGK